MHHDVGTGYRRAGFFRYCFDGNPHLRCGHHPKLERIMTFVMRYRIASRGDNGLPVIRAVLSGCRYLDFGNMKAFTFAERRSSG
mgnify:CR=1 FL=1